MEWNFTDKKLLLTEPWTNCALPDWTIILTHFFYKNDVVLWFLPKWRKRNKFEFSLNLSLSFSLCIFIFIFIFIFFLLYAFFISSALTVVLDVLEFTLSTLHVINYYIFSKKREREKERKREREKERKREREKERKREREKVK